jgi:hypothetical protein
VNCRVQVELDLPDGGTWYIGLYAVDAFSGLTVSTKVLDNSDGYWIQERQIEGLAGSWKDYYMRVNRDVSSLRMFVRYEPFILRSDEPSLTHTHTHAHTHIHTHTHTHTHTHSHTPLPTFRGAGDPTLYARLNGYAKIDKFDHRSKTRGPKVCSIVFTLVSTCSHAHHCSSLVRRRILF